jgi:hypothetical protein
MAEHGSHKLNEVSLAQLVALASGTPGKSVLTVTRVYVNPKEGDSDPVAHEVVIVAAVGFKASNELFNNVKGMLGRGDEDLLNICEGLTS